MNEKEDTDLLYVVSEKTIDIKHSDILTNYSAPARLKRTGVYFMLYVSYRLKKYMQSNKRLLTQINLRNVSRILIFRLLSV